jgi:cob(I)alamin adenosyltransferase
MRRGYIQVYTGNGKGKTTAALGLALRAAGAGLKVFIVQFIKKRRCSEHKMLERFGDLITMRQCGRGFLLKRKANWSDIMEAQSGLDEVREAIASKRFDVVILDEANVAVNCDLFSIDDLLELMAAKPKSIEMIITGRYADQKVIQMADLVTEMKEIKHYRKKGVKARAGIEY